MKTIIKNISLLLCVAATLASCERKPLTDGCLCENTLSIPISIDWETSGIALKNVTVLFYDAESGALLLEHKYEQNSDEIQSYVSLPAGNYTAVIFNELRDQIDYLSCVDYENLSTLRFESNDDTTVARTRSATRSYIKQSGDLAVAVVEEIIVTDDMISEAAILAQSSTKSYSETTRTTVESLMGVTTVKKNTTINITAHFQNIYYARMALVDLVNLADGYYVYGDQNSTTPSTLQFTMNNRIYDEDSYYDGTISTTVTTFGTLGDRISTSGHDSTTPVILDVLFKLIDADWTETEEGEFMMDVTDFIEHETLSDGSVKMTIVAEYPNAITPVEPADSSGDSGFGAEVGDWTEVYVPLKQ